MSEDSARTLTGKLLPQVVSLEPPHSPCHFVRGRIRNISFGRYPHWIGRRLQVWSDWQGTEGIGFGF